MIEKEKYRSIEADVFEILKFLHVELYEYVKDINEQ